jgi:DNA gyrase subunit B
MAVMADIRRLSRRYDSDLLEKMIYMPAVDETTLHDAAAVTQWFSELEQRMNAEQAAGQRYQVDTAELPDNLGIAATVSKWTHGIVAAEQTINGDFFASAEYQRIAELGKQLDGLLSDGAYVQRGERRVDVNSFKQALNWLLEEARRGQHIQRYKGLGEMNPDQLWETTMDPDTRRLLQVQIEDAVGSDQIFTTLMGDQVEPRRDFIEQNALAVSNLDI